MRTKFDEIWSNWHDAERFSGVFSVSGEHGLIFERCHGFRNRGEELLNTSDTAFGIASGTKLFTGLAVCKLFDEKKLSPNDKIRDTLPYDLGQIDKRVTVYHLLTHTSGIGDYIDEEAEDCTAQLSELYKKYPSCEWERLEYYLQMITPLPPKFEPGARYGYSNAGYVLLGLAVEASSGVSYSQFIDDNIIKPCGLTHTGFYRMDSLPSNTALGYMQNGKTNIYNMPIVGGADGGLFTRATDLDKLWRAIFANKILSAEMTRVFATAHVNIRDGDDAYGFGVYVETGDVPAYYAVGGDFGVNFFTAYFPKHGLVVSALGNSELSQYQLLKVITGILRE